MTPVQEKRLLKAQQGELDAVYMYQKLAKIAKNQVIKDGYTWLASEEGKHAAIFFNLTKKVLKPKYSQGNAIGFLARIIPMKFLLKLIAQGEYKAVEKYKELVADFSEVQSVSDDEKKHGDFCMELREKI